MRSRSMFGPLFAIAPCALLACGGSVTPQDGSTDATVDIATDARADVPASEIADVPAASDVNADAGWVDVAPHDGGTYDDILVSGVDLAMFNGVTFHFALDNTAIGSVTATGVATVANGALALTFPAAFDRNLFGMILYVYADTNANGACDASDPAWSVFVNNDFRSGTPVMVTFSPADAGAAANACTYF